MSLDLLDADKILIAQVLEIAAPDWHPDSRKTIEFVAASLRYEVARDAQRAAKASADER